MKIFSPKYHLYYLKKSFIFLAHYYTLATCGFLLCCLKISRDYLQYCNRGSVVVGGSVVVEVVEVEVVVVVVVVVVVEVVASSVVVVQASGFWGKLTIVKINNSLGDSHESV